MLWSETDDRRASEMALGDISSTYVLAPCHTLPVVTGQSQRTSDHFKQKSESVTWRQKTGISGHRSFSEHK